MKRIAVLILGLALLVGARSAMAQTQPPFAIVSGGCSSSLNYGHMPFCFDTGLGFAYYWNGTAYTPMGGYQVMNWTAALGALGSSAVNVMLAPAAGHFVSLACTATITGSCTTGPTINVTDVTAATTGTAVSPTTTVATVASHSESLTFASGDTIGFAQTATTSTCTSPQYACSAVIAIP